jgi:TRAP-type mannitol/chloroaromatic compound transport system permease small subunit
LGSLLKLSALIDGLNNFIGRHISWLTLAMVIISALNAVVRKAFDISSNAFLEIQWYLFAAVFMCASGYAFLKNAHVRIDFIAGKLSKRTQAIIDVLGILIFLFPMCYLMIKLGWPFFYQAWTTGEMSQNAGGLIRWPVLLMIPLGFGILMLQGVSELIKRIAFLMGSIDEPITLEGGKSDEEALAEQLAAEAELRQQGAK